MKIHINNRFILPALIASFGLISAGRVTAQTFTNLYNFTTALNPNYTNSDGAFPAGSLILSGNILYGSAGAGGTNGHGTLFAINTNGTGFTNVYVFSAATTNRPGLSTNSDGISPTGSLIVSGSTLYGTAYAGGTNGNGTAFAINTNGTGFTTLHNFSAGATNGLGLYTNSDGANPNGGLVLSSNILYGTAKVGGSSGFGTVFAVNTNGTGFTNLYSFSAGATNGLGLFTNSDGANPNGGLVLSSNILYGTASSGGTNGNGTVFAVNTKGTGFTNLHGFTTISVAYPYTNSDGAIPHGGLVLSGNTLYGTAYEGGSSGNGTVFAINTNGTGFITLHSLTNSDGADPYSGLFLSGNTLYGTAEYSGGFGTVFAVNTNGSSFTVLKAFPAINYNANNGTATNSNGAFPYNGLIVSGNMLYGTTALDAIYGAGTVFSISLMPQLTIIRSGTNVVLAWPTYANGLTLEFATNLVPPTVWNTNLPAPVLVNGQNAVTNGISGAQMFYRLSQ